MKKNWFDILLILGCVFMTYTFLFGEVTNLIRYVSAFIFFVDACIITIRILTNRGN